MKEEGGDPEAVTDCLLLDSVQGDCFRISAVPSGTMEGKETSPSHHLEESSVLDLPSVCELAECFLPSPSSENSEELFHSMDTFPSLPTVRYLYWRKGNLSLLGTELCLDYHRGLKKVLS